MSKKRDIVKDPGERIRTFEEKVRSAARDVEDRIEVALRDGSIGNLINASQAVARLDRVLETLLFERRGGKEKLEAKKKIEAQKKRKKNRGCLRAMKVPKGKGFVHAAQGQTRSPGSHSS